MKPLFIPLKAEYFDAFKSGDKDTEFRVYGPRWNERTCTADRDARALGRARSPKMVNFTWLVSPIR